MIFKQFPLEKLKTFFLEDFEEKNSLIIFLFLILSLGFYAISWIYNINQKLEIIDDEAPDSKRCFYILFLLPISWSLIYIILSKLIFSNENIIIYSLNIIIWSMILFLSLQYLYEFCNSYGKLTRTLGIVWYLLIYSGYFGIILIFFNINYLIYLIIFPLITIPIMQEFLNITCRYTLEEGQKEHFKNSERLA